MLMLLNLISQVSELLELFVTYNSAALPACGQWSDSELQCAHSGSCHLLHSDYLNKMSTQSYLLKGHPIGQQHFSFLCILNSKGVSFPFKKMKMSSCILNSITFTSQLLRYPSISISDMHNTDICVLSAQTNVIYFLSCQEPLVFSSSKQSTEFDLHKNILELTLLILLISLF